MDLGRCCPSFDRIDESVRRSRASLEPVPFCPRLRHRRLEEFVIRRHGTLLRLILPSAHCDREKVFERELGRETPLHSH
jgi:hypothetical protein